jgi:RNA polymerase-binding transcription factor DksA
MEVAGIRAALERDRELTLAQRDQLRRDLDEVFAAAADVATDDEHDPEGATIAYERSRTTALIEQADAHLADIYGTCVECGGSIADERLRARPAVRTCIACASR